MQQRIFFKNKEDRDFFFLELKTVFTTYKNLAHFLGICRNILEKYRSGELTLSEEKFNQLLPQLSIKSALIINEKISRCDANWGSIKGGLILSLTHPEILAKGRKVLMESKKEKFKINQNLLLNREIAEFLGAFSGDGFTATYSKKAHGKTYLTEYTGHNGLETDYYTRTLIPIIKRNFNSNISPYIKTKDNTIRLDIYSKELYFLLTQRFSYPPGKKVYSFQVPKEILEASPEIKGAFLRGLFDTDGCVFFDFRKAYRNPYPRLQLSLQNELAIQQVYSLLEELHLNPTLSKKTMIQINGIYFVKLFLKMVGFSNQKHINRIKKTNPSLLSS